VCAVTAALLVYRVTLRDILPSWRVLAPATLVGLAVFAEWVVVDQWVPYPHLGSRIGFDPFASFQGPGPRAAFIGVRLYGLVLMVPVMEELFLRSFFLRFVANADFTSVPIGHISWTAFWVVAALTGVIHPEWLVALVASVAYTLLLYRTRSLFATVVAHAVTNGALAWYVLATGNWQYW
jgi:CAAX prenyl protease-like protein